MPIQIVIESAGRLISKLESPELITTLGNLLAQRLSGAAPVSSGATQRALSVVGQPQKTETGWKIGVGSGRDTGQPEDASPHGTLRAFYDYLESTGVRVRRTAWSGLSRDNKLRLEQERRAGRFGGKGPTYANYLWVQNFGNPVARIGGTHFLERAVEDFREEAGEVIRQYLAKE